MRVQATYYIQTLSKQAKNMKQKIITILFFIFFVTNSFACICVPKRLSDLQQSEIKNSECIFIGEVTEINNSNNTFKIKVIESLDGGDSKGNIYEGRNWKYCAPYVNSKGKWLIYGKMEEGFLHLNMCGISRSFENPQEVYNSVSAPLPTSKKENEKTKKLKWEKWKRDNHEKSQADLKIEIIALRQRLK